MTDPTAKGTAWSTTFETGNPDLDAEHIQLLEESGRLRELVLSGSSWNDVQDGVAQLIRDCSEHFRSEESLLRQTEFTRCEEHTAQHRRIESMLQEFSDMVGRVDGTDPQHRQMVASLEVKILDIIVRHDLDYKSHFMNLIGR